MGHDLIKKIADGEITSAEISFLIDKLPAFNHNAVAFEH